ncbi:MAG: STAS domain-containing protein [Proteobacteria bacterium]|nr:STAS domain-containing protein [Pseudomonadota bacterium]
MNLECRVVHDVLVVTLLDGRIDSGNLTGFRDALDPFLAGGITKVAIELSQVEFIDSSGLGALIALFKRLPEQGTLAICNAQDRVLKLLKLTRLNKVFTLCDTLEHCLAELGPVSGATGGAATGRP